MKTIALLLLIAAAYSKETKTMPLILKSPSFAQGQPIPKKHACDGEDVSPALTWSGGPAGVKSYALIMDDPDAPVGTWVHWTIYNIAGSATGLPENVAKKEELPDKSRQGASWGVDTFSRVGYYGPCPPPGKAHRYFFRLYALDSMLTLPAKATKEQILAATKGHLKAQAEWMGTYKR